MAVTGAATLSSIRLDRVWISLPYAVLIPCAAVAWTSGEIAPADVPRAAAACGAVAVWHGWWVLGHRHWLESRLVPMSVYFVGLVVLTDYLTSLAFTFFPLYLVCYPMAFVALPGSWAYAGVALTAVVALLGEPPSAWSGEDLVLGLGSAALVSVAGWAIRALESETERRRAAMVELARTHADLERALADNLALQDRLVTEARDSGVVAERTRLAGEIHDTLAAGLAGIVSQLEALDAQLGGDHPLRTRVTASAELARESLQEARRSVRALRPGPLAEAALPAALSALVTRFQQTHQMPVHLQVTGEVRQVPAPVEDLLLRSVHEALVNVARHAGASAAHVTVSFIGDAVVLDVVDDGIGLDPSRIAGGHGLEIMRERVGAFDGRVEIASSGSHGTTVTVTVPLPPETP